MQMITLYKDPNGDKIFDTIAPRTDLNNNHNNEVERTLTRRWTMAYINENKASV